ncbi:MAG: AMP-binding protein, partial [Dechloromonas sp.]|nr:AMP-binding protein [Dechloromonas sp.]
ARVFRGGAYQARHRAKNAAGVPGAKMLNAYSLTEAGAGAACILGPDPDDILARPGSVGRPVGCEVVVVDDYDNPLPPGKVGEICFKSKIARRSYYKGEQPTAEL